MAAAPAPPSPWFNKWPQLGTDEEFARLRSLFAEANYTVEGVCIRFGTTELGGFCEPPPGGRPMNDTLDALIAFFFDCGFVEETRLSAALPPGTLGLFDSLGLISRDSAPAGTIYTTCAILPVFGVLTACDREAAPDRGPCRYPGDIVYPPVYHTTQRFRTELPTGKCDAMLDLGTGTGIAALLCAPNAGHVWASDILPRAQRFTEFNRRLAGFNNITSVQGDMYSAVEGLTFDRIVTHPPYVSSRIRKQGMVFAEAGDDGEQIIRRAIEGVPRFLRPGGRFHSLQVATDREGESFEQRVRKWLGPGNEEFDVMVAVHSRRSPLEFLGNPQIRSQFTLEGIREWVKLWEETQTEYVVYATLLIERHDQPRPMLTHRVEKGKGYSGRELEWLLDWLKQTIRPDHVDMLLNCRPLARPENEVCEIRRLGENGFQTEHYSLEIPGPFRSDLSCEQWLTEVVPLCDGTRTWREQYEHAVSAQLIRPEVPTDAFARLLGMLIAIGALKI
jgi:SAM-dependent methyltransferase